ncbi:hypothetical protein CU098_011382 [Rhizopus stolonifer]|uniref:P-type Cu(+) transporter n=1 Tax=Rhizopus stolonifer TaxID=4846 RepID=A0A367KNJ0_RHIST|nr:hypothetical protein CU098_011382 [Rhizopus stolonifer]
MTNITSIIPIEGMTCHSCVNAITKALAPLTETVQISLEHKNATITHSDIVSKETLIAAIEDCGFDVPKISEIKLSIQGMTCQSCVKSITNSSLSLQGLESISVSLEDATATIQYQPSIITQDKIIDTIRECGFDAALYSQDSNKPVQPKPTVEPTIQQNITQQSDTTAQLRVTGMTCASCVNSIERGLSAIQGISAVQVSLLAESATVSYDPTVIQINQIIDSINDMGFDATVLVDNVQQRSSRLQLQIFGMTCASCVNAIERELLKMNGIHTVSVNLMTESGIITYNQSTIGPREIVEKIESIGFNALVSDKSKSVQLESLSKIREIKQWRRGFWQSFAFAFPVFLMAMILPEFKWGREILNTPTYIIPGLYLFDVLQLALATPVQFIIGKRFLVSAYQSLKHNAPTMDVLVALSTLSAYFFSIISMIRAVYNASSTRPSVFFDTSATLVTFIMAGRYMENLAKGQSSSALSKLMSLTPSTATMVQLSKDGTILSEKQIPSELVQINDYLKIVPGDKIPTDGVLVSGESSVDESMITGEIDPINKKAGDTVIGGTVNGLGTFVMKAIRVGSETALSQIVRLVEDAQVNKAPIQGFTDRVAGVFVPSVLVLGISTLVIWSVLVGCLGVSHMPALLQHEIIKEGNNGDWFFVCLKMCISVIIVACPCALGLATPTAVMVGTGLAAEHGVIFKGGDVLENGQKVNKVVFDKTGTLTTGQVQVVNYHSWDDRETTKHKMLLLAALAEARSEHLLGRAVINKAKVLTQTLAESSLDHLGSVSDFKSETGYGIQCNVTLNEDFSQPYQVIVGNQAWLEDHHGIGLSDEQIQTIEKELAQGCTSILVAVDGLPMGFISISDTLKPEAKLVIASLHKMGIDTAMVTGDNALTAQCIASRLGITEVHAGISPSGKTQIVKDIQSQLRMKTSFLPWSHRLAPTVVAMVGDGINDSPALAAANLGVALCSGTDIAMEAADVVLMRNDLTDVVVALELSRSIFRRIKLNLLWACIYNMVGIPLAMGIFMPFGLHLPPMMAGMAMAASSTSVVVSSLMLRWFWRKPELEQQVEKTSAWQKLSLATARWRGRGTYQPLNAQDYDLENLGH